MFNLELDKKGGNNNTNFKARAECLTLMTTHHLLDIWREKNPCLKHFTWSSNITPGIYCRLDFFLVAKHLYHAISNVSFSPGIQSDHSFVQLSISHQAFRRGPGLWKLNNSMLNDPDFVVLITDLIENELSNSNALTFDPCIRWDFIKFKIRQACITFSKQKARERNRKEETILNRVASLEQSLFVCESPEIRAQLREAQNELLLYYDYKLQGTIIRSRARWVEEGEKNSKYFLNLEKRNRTSNAIFKIQNTKGELLVENKLILKEIKGFYKTLYTSSECDPGEFFHGLPNRKLDDEEALYCEGSLTLEECTNAIKSMQNDKSPGSDGLSVNFYKKFWNLVGPIVVESLNYGFEKGHLSTEQSRGVISLIAKPGKNIEFLQNYRPITLLNVDYKIGAKVLSARLKTVISKVIGSHQTGFIKGRYIGENIRYVLDLVNFTDQEQIPGFLFLIDFEKAFDKIEWLFIQHTLSFFNFGSSFKRWIEVFYTNSEACVCNNGYTTGFFQVQRGVRQGCPLSPYLFILCAEILALKVNCNNIIRGISVNGIETKLLQYADDTVFSLSDNRESLGETLRVLSNLESASGLTINFTKCNLFPLGPFVRSAPDFIHEFGLSISHGPINFLGISFTHDGDDLFPLNYMPKLSRLKNCLKSWSTRDMTPIGRNTIVKSLALSQLVFLFTVLPDPPDHFIKELEKVIYDFIWGGTPDKIKRTTMISNICDGGLRTTHIASFIKSLKCSWIKRYCDDTKGPWKVFFDMNLKHYGRKLLFECNCRSKDVKGISSIFINDVVKAWCDASFKAPTQNFGDEIIWNNSNILLENKTIYYEAMVEKGVLFVGDLFDDNGKPLTFNAFKRKFNLPPVPFTLYWGVIKAIPSMWRRVGCRSVERLNHNILFYDKITRGTSVSKYVYAIYLDRLYQRPTAIAKWDISHNFDEDDWHVIFNVPWKSVSETKLQYFQFKCIHRILPTNKLLFAMKKVDSPLCSFCKLDDESIEHLFWGCSFTSNFILEVEKRFLNKQFFFSKEDILFGYCKTDTSPLNFLILHMKYFIFNCKRQNSQLDINNFYYKMKFALQVEQFNYFKTSRVKKSKVNFPDLKRTFAICF